MNLDIWPLRLSVEEAIAYAKSEGLPRSLPSIDAQQVTSIYVRILFLCRYFMIAWLRPAWPASSRLGAARLLCVAPDAAVVLSYLQLVRFRNS